MKRFIFFLCVASFSVAVRGQSNDPETLSPETVTSLSESFTRLRGPLAELRIGVVVGTTRNGQFVTTESRMEQAIKADLLQQLPKSRSIRVIDDKVVAKGVETAQGALQRRAGAEVASLTAKLVAESVKADIVLIVELMPDAQQQNASREFRAFDMRFSPPEVLARETYVARALNPSRGGMADAEWLGMMRRGTTDMLIKLGASMARLETYVPEYRIQVLELQPEDQKSWTRAIRQSGTESLVILPTPMEIGRETANSTPLVIRYNGVWDDLEDTLATTALKTLERRLRTVFYSGSSDAIVTLQETSQPLFFKFTGADAAAPEHKVGSDIAADRRPTVSIIWGDNVDAPRAAQIDERQSVPPLAMSGEVAARTLGSYFTAAGFEVKDSVAMRQKLTEEVKRSNLDNNLSGTRDALRRSNASDYLVLVRTEPTTKNLALTIVNNRGAQVAFAHYPDSKVLLYEQFVNPKDPASLMRYLSGSLLQQLRTYALNSSLRSIEVVVKNTRSAQQILDVAAAFRTMTEDGVQSVTDLHIDQPIGSFSVNTTGDVASLVQKAAELAANRQLGVKGIVEVANEQQMVLNVASDSVSLFDLPEAQQMMEELQQPDAPKPAGLAEAMVKARESVWLVGVDMPDGKFSGIGTAWTVGPKLLATNAHVVAAIRTRLEDARAKKIRVTPVARNGDNLSKSLAIDAEHLQSHPGYDAFNEKYGKTGMFVSAYDVGLVPTVDNAGTVLRMASTEDLKKLQPLATIGYSGYPQENRRGQGRSQQSLMGTINSVTTVFLQDSTDGSKQKIIHFSLPAAGGASGSPVFGADGTVIGLLSAGDNVLADFSYGDSTGGVKTTQRRVPLGFTYGQRVDMLAELIEGRVDLAAINRGWEQDYATVTPQLQGR